MKKLSFIICFVLSVLWNQSVYAADPYWVDDNGAAAWVDCQSASALSGASACAIETANSNASAGDTVYLREGTYSVTTYYATGGFHPTNSGSAGNVITFSAYSTETVTMQGAAFPGVSTANLSNGIFLNGKNYIKITGGLYIQFFNNSGTYEFRLRGASGDASGYFELTPGNKYRIELHIARGSTSGLKVFDSGGSPVLTDESDAESTVTTSNLEMRYHIFRDLNSTGDGVVYYIDDFVIDLDATDYIGAQSCS